ncbi:hypothetical protein J5O01_08645, partial [Streptococcus suis]|nr:hypothetical protein [Streptococcus suis]
KIGLTTTLKNAWTTSRQVNFFWVANFNLKFGEFASIREETSIFIVFSYFLRNFTFENFYKITDTAKIFAPYLVFLYI